MVIRELDDRESVRGLRTRRGSVLEQAALPLVLHLRDRMRWTSLVELVSTPPGEKTIQILSTIGPDIAKEVLQLHMPTARGGKCFEQTPTGATDIAFVVDDCDPVFHESTFIGEVT